MLADALLRAASAKMGWREVPREPKHPLWLPPMENVPAVHVADVLNTDNRTQFSR
jgi:hypothetical protein